MERLSARDVNRRTLARQHLLARATLDAVAAVRSLAGMQAQYSPSPYIGLWSRLVDFRRDELEAAVRDDLVIKATLMRNTLHLVTRDRFAAYRAATRRDFHDQTASELAAADIDVEAIRAYVAEQVLQRPHTRTEVAALVASRLPKAVSRAIAANRPPALAGVAITTDLVNLPCDAMFGYLGASRYRLAPPAPAVDAAEALRQVAHDYFAAFGPATRADLAQWSGRPVRAFREAVDSLDLVQLRTEDGRTLLDLRGVDAVGGDVPAPVRFLPKWDNLLLAYARRERVLPDWLRRVVIRPNGTVVATFLVDGVVAGRWKVAWSGRPLLTLRPFIDLLPDDREEVVHEGVRLAAWIRPGSDPPAVEWQE